jgi:hypothetical protein
MKLDPSTLIYQEWLNPPIDIYMSFYVFNLKNHQAFMKGEKPEFEGFYFPYTVFILFQSLLPITIKIRNRPISLQTIHLKRRN